MTLYGKGYYIWQIPKCDGGVPGAIAARAKAAGLTHVLIKIADGVDWVYNYNQQTKTDLVPPVMAALRQVGISVWGWHYVRGDDPVGEARLAINRVLNLGVDGYAIDAEGEYRTTTKREAARKFMKELRAGLPHMPIALSSYRFPRIHTPFPFAEFLERCDINMPQVYFEGGHNPEQQLERCLEQYAAIHPVRPMIPTAPTYTSSTWRPTPDEITRFFAKARQLGFTAANAWSYDWAHRTAYRELWDAVAAFSWPAEPPPAELPDRLVALWNKGDVEGLSGLYRDNAAHVTGARTVIGLEPIKDWYRTVLKEMLPGSRFELTGKNGAGNSRRFTWKASGPRGTVLDGHDTLGLNQGRIQYHYTYFTVR